MATSRERFRSLLAGRACVQPASVFDAVSQRIAAALGYEAAVLAGSISSAAVLAAPDLVLLTLTELAAHVQRITRASSLPLLVDADHGFGNALNAMRTVEELEAAGAAALTIEDTLLPAAYGAAAESLISIEEMTAKLRAAMAARRDAALAIVGRTAALRHGGIPEAERRLRAFESAGVDALFLVGARTREQVQAVGHATRLPLMLYAASAELSDAAFLAEHGVRIAIAGHQAFPAAVKAIYDTLKHLREGGSAAALKDRVAGDELLRQILRQDEHEHWQDEYLARDKR